MYLTYPQCSQRTVKSEPMEQTVNIPLKELIRIFRDASNCEQTWTFDFEDDEVFISSDLYEILTLWNMNSHTLVEMQ